MDSDVEARLRGSLAQRRDRTAAVGAELLGGVQHHPKRFGEPETHVVLADAEQHHRDLVRCPAAHPRDQGPDLGVVLPQTRVVEARCQQQAQNRGPALLVRARREPPVDFGPGLAVHVAWNRSYSSWLCQTDRDSVR